MKLRVALLDNNASWRELCRTEGVPFDTPSLDALLPESFSVLVVNRPLVGHEHEVIAGYLRGGGAIMGATQFLEGVAGVQGVKSRIEYLLSDHDPIFPDIHLLDLGMDVVIPREAQTLRLQDNAFGVFAGPMGGGCAVVLPFDAGQALADARSADKTFYGRWERLPTERVSLVAKGELMRLFHRSLEFLHHARGLPYAHLWYFPEGLRNIFVFRVDTDGGTQPEIETLYRIAHETGIGMTWFLDVRSHESWLGEFARMVNQEIGVHCYEHRTFSRYDAILKDVQKAVHCVRETGLRPAGYAAPYGAWSPELYRVIGHLGFEYSSEFSYAYDALPFSPERGNEQGTVLQVPIHPISIGSLRRIAFTPERMMEYYHQVITAKFKRNEAMILYHHPGHHAWDVVRFIIEDVRKMGIPDFTMGRYASWWRRRLTTGFQMEMSGDGFRIDMTDPAGSTEGGMYFRITHPRKGECMAAAHEVAKASLRWSPAPDPLPPPEDIRRIREFDPRASLGNLYTRLSRKFR